LIIQNSSEFKIASFCSYLACLFSLCLVLSFIFFGILFFASGEKKEQSSSVHPMKKTLKLSEHYSSIGKGALSLNAGKFYGSVPNLGQEVALLGKNSRPGVKLNETELLLYLKSSKEELLVLNGEKIYLKGESPDEVFSLPLHFSEAPTSLWLTPHIDDKERASIIVGMKVSITGEEEREETARFSLEMHPSFKGKHLEITEPFQNLVEARLWGIDQLIQKYGGEEYRHLKEKQKLEFSKPFPYTCFVGPGDLLIWKEREWRVSSIDEVKPDLLVAQVKAISGHALEIEAWDERGFYPHHVRVPVQHVPKMVYRPENLPTSFRMRTSSQVTCVLGKRRMILKQGDWLLKTLAGWHILKKVEEIEGCLQHRIKGELFIFDRLEKDDGKVVLKGTLFDEMRTQFQQVEIPIVGDKKIAHKQRKKKHVLSKKSLVSSRFSGKEAEHR
jgi:ribosome-associated translation inhibitor RaiA